MKKLSIKKPRFNKFQPGSLISYVLATFFTSLIIVTVLIALPLTEEVSSNIYYNLINKNESYWEREYILKLDTEDLSDEKKDKYIEDTRDILYRRLNKAGVEEASIYVETLDGKDILRITVKTSLDETLVSNLIENRYFVRVVTRKDDVDFDDEENPYAYLFAENYDNTEFTGSFFRHVLITQLKNSSGEYSYFAVFKTYIWTNSKFQEFLSKHEGEYIGVSIDGYVTPYYVDTSNPKVFAITVYGGESQSELIDILYNSGEIPLSFTVEEGEISHIDDTSFNYLNLSAGLLTATIVIYASLYFFLKEDRKVITLSLFSTLLTISIWISYLKLSSTPVDLWMLSVECIFSAVLIYVLTNNKESQISIAVSLALNFLIFMLLGLGYMRIYGTQMILVLLISLFSIAFSKWYLNKMRIVLTR
jgi:hypothetical protein